MTLPYRALLPLPLPDNVVPIQTVLDRLILHVGGAGGRVMVESEATGASATLADAVRYSRIGVGEGETRFEIPVTRTEVAVLRQFLARAEDWELAAAAGDRNGMASSSLHLQDQPAPWWLDLRIALPRRRSVARLA